MAASPGPASGDPADVRPAPRRFVAAGDSFTEGMSDDLGPDGRHLGWADRVAAALAVAPPAPGAGLQYANLAVRGKLLDEIVRDQVPTALAYGPDLLSFHAGGNDALRPRMPMADLVRRYDEAVGSLRASGAQVLVFTVLERAGGTGRAADRLAGRFRAFNTGVRTAAGRHGATLVDVGAITALQDRRFWNEDRLHLAAHGHARVAAAVLETLGITDDTLLGGPPGWFRVPLPPGAVLSRRAAATADVRWLRRHLLPWVGRRLRGTSSGDGVVAKRPELLDVVPVTPGA